MKKIVFLFVLTSLMVISFTTITFAGTLYFDTTTGGKWEYEDLDHDSDFDEDLSMTNIGLDFVNNRFVYGFELIMGTENAGLSNGENADFVAFNGRFGYRAVDNDNLDLDLFVKLDCKCYDDDINTTLSATLIGIDLGFNLSDNLYIQGSASISIAGYAMSDDIYEGGYYYDGLDEDASCTILKAKGTYFFTESIGASLGYRYYLYKIDAGVEPQTTDSGLTIGLAFKF